MLRAGIGSIRQWVALGALSDPDVVLYAARVSVWSRWFKGSTSTATLALSSRAHPDSVVFTPGFAGTAQVAAPAP